MPEMDDFLALVFDLNEHQLMKKRTNQQRPVECSKCRSRFPCDARRALWIIVATFKQAQEAGAESGFDMEALDA